MSGEVVIYEGDAAVAPIGNGSVEMFTASQVQTLRQTIARDCTPQQLELFLATCRMTGLNPFQQEIYPVVRNGQLTIQFGVNGYRRVAESAPEYRGYIGPQWCGPDGVWRDEWLEDTPPAAARFAVIRSDWPNPAWAFVRYKSFAQNTPTWNRMPEHMLGKTAEVHAFKRAFGLRIREVQEKGRLSDPDEIAGAVDRETGEVLERPSGQKPPVYTDVKDNARVMSRLHARAAEKGVKHEQLRVLANAWLGYPSDRSMSELSVDELERVHARLDASPIWLRAELARIEATTPEAGPPEPAAEPPNANSAGRGEPKVSPQMVRDAKALCARKGLSARQVQEMLQQFLVDKVSELTKEDYFEFVRLVDALPNVEVSG